MREEFDLDERVMRRYWYHDGNLYDHPLTWLLACVVGTLGNADTLSTFILHKSSRDPCLINLAAGNLLAMLCLPFNCLQHFTADWDLGYALYTVFWISRDVATGLQIYSVAVFSVLRYFRLKYPENLYEQLPRSEPIYFIRESGAAAEPARRVAKISATFQTALIWCLALMYAVPSAIFSETYSVVRRRTYEDVDTSAIFHSLAFCFVPLIVTLVFYAMAEYRNYKVPSRNPAKHARAGRLVFWLSVVILINYVPFYSWIIYAWANHFQLLIVFSDFATYFPLYSTACWIPVVVFFATYKPLEKLKECASLKCSSKNGKQTKTESASVLSSSPAGSEVRTNQIILSVAPAPK